MRKDSKLGCKRKDLKEDPASNSFSSTEIFGEPSLSLCADMSHPQENSLVPKKRLKNVPIFDPHIVIKCFQKRA